MLFEPYTARTSCRLHLSLNVRQWEVEKLENGNYKFKANHCIAVGAINGLLFAILFEHQLAGAAIEWTLKRDERDTEGNAYVYV